MEPHFLPDIGPITQEMQLPGWAKDQKPEKRFWDWLEAGTLKRRNEQGELETITEVRLPGKTVLLDTRLKPNFNLGKQMWADDEQFCGGIIKRLRELQTIECYHSVPSSSRFGVSATEFEQHIAPALAKKLSDSQHDRQVKVVLESTIVANMVPQLFAALPRAGDGQTATWTWYQEFFKSADRRLDGGDSGYGGLADVNYDYATDRSYFLAFRPLGVLD